MSFLFLYMMIYDMHGFQRYHLRSELGGTTTVGTTFPLSAVVSGVDDTKSYRIQIDFGLI